MPGPTFDTKDRFVIVDTTPAFDTFRRRLADAVTVAINNGVRVSAGNLECHCPLGCLQEVVMRRPFPSERVPLGRGDAWAFIVAFERGHATSGYPEYTALGLAYRKRFP